MDILVIDQLQKSFGNKKVLSSLNMRVPEHSIFGFIGKNGVGKTTTMKAILGLLQTDGGEIYVANEKVKFGQTETNRHIGYLPDVPEFYPFMTPKEYLRLCGESLRMEHQDIEKRSKELLHLVGLSEENRRIKGFSRGMKQRLGIAQALLARPTLLICDEPTSALDPIGRKEILDILLSLKNQTTVLFSSHILSDVERICTDIAFLHEGKIKIQGKVSDLKQMHTTEEFSIEMCDHDGASQILNSFRGTRLIDANKVLFCGGEEEIFHVLSFIGEKKLSLLRIERAEPSLEALFMEVSKS